MLIGYEDAQNALNPYYEQLWKIVTSSWEKYNSLSEEYTSIASKRGRATVVNDFVVALARQLSFDDSRFQNIEINGMFCLLIPTDVGLFAIRLKKLNIDGTSSNQLTKQVKSFKEHEEIAGLENAYHLEMGYVLNDYEEFNAVMIACPSGEKSICWKAEVTTHGVVNGEEELFASDTIEPNKYGFKVVRKDIIGDENEATGS